jgi:hypothetical protein
MFLTILLSPSVISKLQKIKSPTLNLSLVIEIGSDYIKVALVNNLLFLDSILVLKSYS